MKKLEVGYPSDMSRRCIETVQFPRQLFHELCIQPFYNLDELSYLI